MTREVAAACEGANMAGAQRFTLKMPMALQEILIH